MLSNVEIILLVWVYHVTVMTRVIRKLRLAFDYCDLSVIWSSQFALLSYNNEPIWADLKAQKKEHIVG